MPPPATTDAFLDLVRKAEVVDNTFLDACLQRINRKAPPEEPHQLADRLVAEGALTYYQAVQILKGRTNCFRIGAYRILERLGFGATSNVYLCEHKATHARMAVKVLTQAQAEDPVALRRFLREAKAATLAEHPNLVRVHDVDWDNQDNFMVMDFVDGSSVLDIVQQFGPMDIHRACHCIRQAALGLHFLYQAGLFHRDIKPGNILIDRKGNAKILDMGLARFAEEEGGRLTQGEVLGSPEYMSPEQALDSHNVDHRTDIYSLGATLYYLLGGEAPFGDEKSPAAKLLSKAQRPPRPLAEIHPDLPEDLVKVVETMMARNPDDRYQTPREAAEALKPWTQTPLEPPPTEEMPQLSPAAMAVSEKPKKKTAARPTPGTKSAAKGKRRVLWVVILQWLVFLVLAGLAFFLAWMMSH
jgi:serine/threonine protein kinase